jgi:hypothetical protein
MNQAQVKNPQAGQSTIEYILMVTGVIAVVLFLTTGRESTFQSRLANTVNTTLGGMEDQAQKLTNSVNN